MKISELQDLLQSYKNKFGDLDIWVQDTGNEDVCFELKNTNFSHRTYEDSDKVSLTIWA